MSYVPSVCNLVRGFYHEWCWYLSNAFPLSIGMIMWVFSFVDMVYHIHLCILNHPCGPGMNLVWSWSLMCRWIWFANIFLRIFVYFCPSFMLLKCCTHYASKFGKFNTGHRTGNGLFSFQSQRRAKWRAKIYKMNFLYSSKIWAVIFFSILISFWYTFVSSYYLWAIMKSSLKMASKLTYLWI